MNLEIKNQKGLTIIEFVRMYQNHIYHIENRNYLQHLYCEFITLLNDFMVYGSKAEIISFLQFSRQNS